MHYRNCETDSSIEINLFKEVRRMRGRILSACVQRLQSSSIILHGIEWNNRSDHIMYPAAKYNNVYLVLCIGFSIAN